jgi:hypothetical protein
VTALFALTDDGIRITLPSGLVDFLVDVPQALDLVGSSEADPAAGRFKVPVYLDDDGANDEYWRWMGSELDSSRAADRSAFALIIEEAAEGVVVSREEAYAFLRVLVEIRLALAARLGVEVEDDYQQLDHTDAVVMDTLAELQIMLIAVLRS